MKLIILALSAFIIGVNCIPVERLNNCITACPMYIIQFCGSDGKTYNSNECFVKNQLCSQGSNAYESFSSLHYGACTGEETLG